MCIYNGKCVRVCVYLYARLFAVWPRSRSVMCLCYVNSTSSRNIYIQTKRATVPTPAHCIDQRLHVQPPACPAFKQWAEHINHFPIFFGAISRICGSRAALLAYIFINTIKQTNERTEPNEPARGGCACGECMQRCAESAQHALILQGV